MIHLENHTKGGLPVVLSRNSFEPLYYQIREDIRNKIHSKEYPPNSMIPTEAELCEMYNVSRVTVRRAVLDLVKEGLLNRGKGKGTFVSEYYGMTAMNGIQSFTQELLGLNMRPSAKVLSCKIRKADRLLQTNLELTEGDTVVTLSRLRLVDNEPCMVEVMNFPHKLVPGIENEDLTQSIYRLLKDKYHLEVVQARDIMEPIIVGEYESKLLQMPMPSAGLRTYRLGRDENDRAIEYTTHIIPGKKCTLVFDRTK